jgi:TolB protein
MTGKAMLRGLFLLLLLVALPAKAQLTIEIVDGQAGALPIAVVPFAFQGQGEADTDVAQVISNNLARSGLFEPVDRRDMVQRPSRLPDINFGSWRLLETDHVVIGRISENASGYDIEVELYDVLSTQRVMGQRLRIGWGELRNSAHRISDLIYEALIGVPGAFFTRIAYVTVVQGSADPQYQLVVADSDGFNPQTIVSSTEPLLSPSWSPDGRRLAYVSFERGNSSIYIQDIATGQRREIASFKGINGAPAWSPDGERLALTLSRSGQPEIYIMQVSSGALRQVTNHWAIDTEAVWMPDGESLLFTSDRGGQPNIYRVGLDDESPKRITFAGGFNSRASVAPDGERVAIVHGEGNVFRIGVQDVDSGRMSIVTDGPLDESPSFAPNGSMILYAARENERGILKAVSADGRVSQRLVLSEGDVREPAWSPIRQ